MAPETDKKTYIYRHLIPPQSRGVFSRGGVDPDLTVLECGIGLYTTIVGSGQS